MTWQDGGGKWWLNESTPGRLSFREIERHRRPGAAPMP